LEINPNSIKAHYNLGITLGKVGRADEAIPHFVKALELNPGSADINCNLGVALQACGRVDAAISHYSRALEINPNSVPVIRNLSWVLATCSEPSLRNGLRAVGLAEQANRLTGGSSPAILATLAAAYAETERFEEAVETAQAALQLAKTQSDTDLASMLRREIKLYESGQPFRDGQ
jgi:serine/threonine-protein kinase